MRRMARRWRENVLPARFCDRNVFNSMCARISLNDRWETRQSMDDGSMEIFSECFHAIVTRSTGMILYFYYFHKRPFGWSQLSSALWKERRRREIDFAFETMSFHGAVPIDFNNCCPPRNDFCVNEWRTLLYSANGATGSAALCK